MYPLNFMKLTVTMLICLKFGDRNTPLLITLGFTENCLTSEWLFTNNLLKLISDYFLIKNYLFHKPCREDAFLETCGRVKSNDYVIVKVEINPNTFS